MMKLEIIIALTLGASLGIGGMLGIVMLTKNIKPAKSTTLTTQTEKPSVDKKLFSLIGPLNKTTQSAANIDVSGNAPDNSPILIVSQNEDKWVVSENELFNLKLTTIQGINTITAINTKTQEKASISILNLNNLPINKSYQKGTVTDITEEYLQLRLESGSIEQVSISKITKALSVTKSVKEIGTRDVAIGDIVLVVYEKDIKVGPALFVIVMNGQNEPTPPHILVGKLSLSEKNRLTLTSNNENNNLVVTFNSKTKLFGINEEGTLRTRTKFIETDIGSEIFAVVTASDSASPARSIFIRSIVK